jgi:hypothetical protein
MLEKVIDAAKVKIRDTHGVTLARWIPCARLIMGMATCGFRSNPTFAGKYFAIRTTIDPSTQLLQVLKSTRIMSINWYVTRLAGLCGQTRQV